MGRSLPQAGTSALGLYAIKPWFVRRLRGAEDLLVDRNVPADALTAAGLGAGLLAGAAVVLGGALGRPALWLAVAPLGIARLAFNALDGSVARRTGTARPFGLALNEVADRLADVAMIGAAGLLGHPMLAAAAVVSAFLTSFIGVLGHAAGGSRLNSGPMGKADRVAVIGAAGIAAAASASPTPFAVALGLVLAGSVVTSAARLHALRGRR